MPAESVEGLAYLVSECGQTTATGESTRASPAFEEVFLAHYQRVVAVLFRLLGDRNRAEELANETFWRASRQPAALALNGSIGGWLYRAATNLGIEELRATSRRTRYEHAAGGQIPHADPVSTPLEELLRAERRAKVRAVLALLKRWKAQILILRSSGLSYDELSAALGMKRSSVGTMLARAEAEFQKRYFQMHGREE